VTTTDEICNCGENAEQQVRMFSQRVQWTPLLLVVSVFACENTHSVALGYLCHYMQALLKLSMLFVEGIQSLTADTFVSVSIDQRLHMWSRPSPSDDKEWGVESSKFVSVADVSTLCCYR